MSAFLYRLGRFSAGRPWVVIGAWVVVAVAVVAASSTLGRELEDSFEVPGLDSQRATELLESASSDRAGLTAQVVMAAADGTSFYDSAASQAALAEVQQEVASLPKVVTTTDPAGAVASGDPTAAAGMISPDGEVALLMVQYPVLEDLDVSDLENLEVALDELGATSPLQIEAGGDLYSSFDGGETGTAELIGIAAAVVILLLAFGSVIAMGLPIGMAIFGLLLGISAMALVAYVVDVPSWAPQMASMIGLGVGIDYALFLVTRHREYLADGHPVADAAGRAVATAGQAVVFAGGTVVIAILGLGVAGVPFMTAAGIATSMIVAIMVIASITLLPAFLGLAGGWINRIGIHRRHSTGTVGARWERWGRHVSRHAWPYAIGVTVLLLALTAPVLALQLGFPDAGTSPESMTQRRAYDLVADGFGPGTNGPLVIAVDVSADQQAGELVDDLSAAIAADPGIAQVAPAEFDADAGVASIVAIPTSAPQDAATFDTVQRLRGDVFVDVLDGTEATAHVGGATANFGDVAGRISDRLPIFIAAVVGLSFLLLTAVFRSVVVAAKAALLNLLRIGAAYGVLVMVFQWGWAKGLIGLESTVPIVSFIPMFMFAVLFGLSMDYEVFLLSRVREEYLRSGDNDRAVITGLATTARVITSAALIMIAVFAGFVLGDDPIIKMMGLGLATAILVDATIVRIVLVPAMMKLMGDTNWWLPGWLDRLLPNIDIDAEPDVGDDVDGNAAIDAEFDDQLDDGPGDGRGDRELVGSP
ncbi:MAG: MMPL family transporter [Actinomycetota bacterium]